MFLVGAFIVSYVLFYFNKQKRNEFEKRELTQKFQETILLTQLEIREQTLKNISEEIHDNIGQALSLAKLNLNMIDPSMEEDRETKIQNTKLLVGKAIQDLRDLSRSFNTDNINALGLAGALDQEFDLMRKTGKYSISVLQEGTTRRIPAQHTLITFRIVQEVLQNIIKHAEAQKIDAVLSYEANYLRVKIQDDGRGFTQEGHSEGEPTLGLGIRNMNSRAALIGGSVVIDSIPGKGTTVILMIPISPAP